MKKMTENEIVKKACEIWHGVVYNYRDGKKLNKADLNKVMSAYQKLVLLDLEDALVKKILNLITPFSLR